MNKKIAYSYYFVIILIMALWDGIDVAVPMSFRLLFLALTFLPLFKWTELFPAVFVSTLTISFCAFTMPLLPTSIYFYVIISIVFAGFAMTKRKVLPRMVFVVIFVFIWLLDIALEGKSSYTATRLLLCLLAFIVVQGDGSRSNEHLSYAFMMIAIVLSYWVLLRPEARLEAKHAMEGFEDSAGWTDPNYLGSMIALGGTVAVNELFKKHKTLLKEIFCILSIGLSVLSIAYLASRGAIVALAAGTIVLTLLSRDTKKSHKIIFVVVLSAFLFLFFRSGAFDLIFARFQADSMGTGTGRTLIWQAKLNAFYSEGNIIKWLFGFGHEGGLALGHFGKARAFHNDFVAALVEYGLVGFSLFIYTFYCIIKHAPGEYRRSVIGLLSAYVAIAMTLEPTICDMPSSIVFMFFLFYLLMFSRIKEPK